LKIDLNLFVVFDAIYCEGNITKAASTLNLSQPAVSHSLRKLRRQFDDPLFVRHGNEMRPTAVARNVIADVRESLHMLKICLVQSKTFEPSTSRKEFSISLHASLEAAYLPPLVKGIGQDAPNINLQTTRRVRGKELEKKLASGDIDLAIDALIPVDKNVMLTQIDSDELVVIARKDHTIIGKELSLKTYLSLKHVLVSSRSKGLGIEDYELGRLGMQREIALRCQHNLSACQVVMESDMILTLPKTAATMYSNMLNITIHPLPVKLPNIDAHLYWHENVDNDPSNRWLREKVISTLLSTL
jgi:DNA-binding transcriptional LysR family regulator